MRDGKYVILYVDDDADLLEVTRLRLERAGYLVETAANGEEGLEVYRSKQPDLIVVDLMMEEIDAGTNFVKEIKAMGGRPPVYMLSSVGDQLSMSANPEALGLDGVFQKPIDFGLLLRTLKARLQGKGG